MAPSQPPQSVETVVQLLRWRSEVAEPGDGFAFLNADGDVDARLSFQRLETRARAIASTISDRFDPGDRALLLYPPSLEYVEAFFGCLFAGVIAVPAYPPNPNQLERTLPRLEGIVADADAAAALATGPIKQMAEAVASQADELAALDWIATDAISDDGDGDFTPPDVDGDTLAFLQYTSGSTGAPKGVMVDHRVLMKNQALIESAFKAGDEDVGVNWLPLYHDMGLLGAIIQPVYCGCDSVLMSPLDFLKRPPLWVEAISKFGGTMSTAPNFAYDLVVRKTPPDMVDELDLSSWKGACNGAEPVRKETMDRFADYFADCGFDKRAFMPAYGLAEVGLIVSATPRDEPPDAVEIDDTSHVPCGRLLGDFDAAIVDPDSHRRMPDGEVGEVWLKDGSVARGYWDKPKVNTEVFEASIPGEPGRYLRTGDLGAMVDDRLIITGRLKDVIVIRGVNHYPHDIEVTVESVDTSLRPGCGAAFSVEDDNAPKLVIVQEVRPGDVDDPEELIRRIRQAVSQTHRVAPTEVVLIEPRTIEKTSSGKIRRFAVREDYLAGDLNEIASGGAAASADSGEETASETGSEAVESQAAIERWLVERVASEADLSDTEIDADAPFSAYGIDSADAVGIVGELERWLGADVSATALYDFPTIAALARHLSEDEPPPQAAASHTNYGGDVDDQRAVAIVGMACRFPGADGIDAFWELIESGEDAFDTVPESRWEPETFSDPEIAGFDAIATDRGGYVDDLERFDAGLFGIAPKEARAMDPQQRMVLETTWHALEDAGWPTERLAGTSTGVFVGQSGSDFARLYQGPPVRAGSGIAPSITANRLSYLLNLRGPSVTVDTACSSSLVALDQALMQIRSGRCDRAIVGGVNAILAPDMTQAFSRARMLSPEGICRVFDEAADGYVRGEGCGVVALMPLAEAKRRGCQIRAVIRGGATNQDGRTNGLTAPSGTAQREVIERAWEDAGVDPSTVEAVEAHGTGTELGDAIEVQSLRDVFGCSKRTDRPLRLGSVKAQIGHLEAAAGIAGVIKAALVVDRGRIGPQANFESPNPACDFDEGGLVVPREPFEWPGADADGPPRRMGVSAFGFGGTNAHVVVEQPPVISTASNREDSGNSGDFGLVGIGTVDTTHLAAWVEAMVGDDEMWSSVDSIVDLGWSLGRCRTAGSARIGFVAESPRDARDKLRKLAAGDIDERAVETGGTTPRVGLAIGDLDPETTRQLRDDLPAFQRAFDDTLQRLEDLGESMSMEQLDDGARREVRFVRFVTQLAILETFDEWGVTFEAVRGSHTAELAADVFSKKRSVSDALEAVGQPDSGDKSDDTVWFDDVERPGTDVGVAFGTDDPTARNENTGDTTWLFASEGGGDSLIEIAAGLWELNCGIRRCAVNSGGRRVDLPKTPLIRRRYWPDGQLRRIEPGE